MISARDRTGFADVNEFNDGRRFALFYSSRRQTSNDVLVVPLLL
jgi:hypothetical protein